VSIDGGACEISKIQRVLARLQSGALRRHLLRWLFQDNLALIDFVRCQPLIHPLVCLGDGHDGVWNLFREIAPERWEILDWYHLKENLYKVGGSLKRLTQAEALLWQGKTDEAKALVNDCQRKPVILRHISTSTALGLSIMPITRRSNCVQLVPVC